MRKVQHFKTHWLAVVSYHFILFSGLPESSLWEHEWLKHGTCASVLPELSNENKYFGQGLAWFQQYTMTSLLSKAGYTPDMNTTVEQLNDIITSSLTRNPSIHCIVDRETKQTYLSEIRICFDKQLELVDCNGVVDSLTAKPITNCKSNQPILYPSRLPQYLIDRTNTDTTSFNWKFPLVNFYKLIQLLKILNM